MSKAFLGEFGMAMVRSAVLAILLLTLTSATLLAESDIKPLLLTGQPAPGFAAGSTLRGFSALQFNKSGYHLFHASISEAASISTGPVRALYLMQPDGEIQLVAQTGGAMPGFSDPLTLDSLLTSTLGPNGDVAFIGIVENEAKQKERGLWRFGEQGLQLVARTGQAATGLSEETFQTFSIANINATGDLAFQAGTLGEGDSGSGGGIWIERGGNLDLIVAKGDSAPGFSSPAIFSSFSPFLGLDDQGHLSFSALASEEYGIWRESPSGLELVIAQGDDLPNTDPAEVLDEIQSLLWSRTGTATFLDVMSLVDEKSSSVLVEAWLTTPAGLSRLGGSADPALRLPGPLQLSYFQPMHVTDSGQVAIVGGLGEDGAFPSELYPRTDIVLAANEEAIRIVAKRADEAPGTDGEEFYLLHNAATNSSGQVAFLALTAEGTPGIWAEDRQGLLQHIVSVGDEIEIEPGDLRTLTSRFVPSGFDDIREFLPYFTDRGDLYFTGSLDDGTSGIFISHRVVVPEPSVLLSLVVSVPLGTTRSLHRVTRRT